MSSTEPAASAIEPPTANTTTKANVPVLGESFQETNFATSKSASNESSSEGEQEIAEDGKKLGKRRLFGFGRKKEESKAKDKNKAGLALAGTPSQVTSAPKQGAGSPQPTTPNHPYMARSPDRNLHSSSPRTVSPAGSQIFERDVQDSTLLVPMPVSPVPGHLQVDDHIPSVLDASSEAITNNELNPDTVEIVMHSSHQPAAVTVTGATTNDSMSNSWAEDLVSHPEKDDPTSNYGTLDAADVRRLSFISFADVVQSEHAEHAGSRDPVHVAGLTSLSSGHRSPSPMRSPVSSQGFNTSPPTSKSASVKGVELSPTRGSKPLASPTLSTHGMNLTGGELTIETMSQALKKTQSGDLSGTRSPASPDGISERLLR